jgi:ubiquinone/menaquinone biosynthesis C-methylase UbiE
MSTVTQLAVKHWNRTPLFLGEQERYHTYPWLYEAAEFREHRDEDVLEIGCGTGCDLLQFAKHGARAVGVDITPEHLRLARERVGELARVLSADARNLPFPDARFDYVYSHGVLHHLDDPATVVKEMLRVLRPSGRFNVHVYALWSYVPVHKLYKHGMEWKRWIENSSDPVHIELYTARRLRKLFGEAIAVRKYQCSYAQNLGRWIGWFLVAKGQRPR